ncbi:MAG: aa3-type cytochrome c oxidase subunit IV [Pseudomonadota bacterium]
MDIREQEKTYRLFTGLAKWGMLVAAFVTFIVVAVFIA